MSKKTVMIGMHGSSYSNQFMLHWSMALNNLWKNKNYEIYVVQAISENHIYARLQTLGIDLGKDTKDQKPFQGLDYDVFVMIDPDVIFKPEDLEKLIERSLYKNNDVVSGLYPVDHKYYFASLDKELMKIDNEKFDNETPVDVSFVGLGFFACKKKVIDSLEFPYFTNVFSEEMTFCKSIKDKGFSITLYKDLRVGKKMLLTM